ncbi:unnamed protein product [Pseudo-nitzschia multistriata]|uniref:Helicase-associated domain-containing protein n=1 Tax=Pseudo-nitzschia multistriata TaxID=183589 RepID=A0A448Z6Z7_9STRA|nr:unnamed protein product [Pseudo-nitzschia multistriata]
MGFKRIGRGNNLSGIFHLSVATVVVAILRSNSNGTPSVFCSAWVSTSSSSTNGGTCSSSTFSALNNGATARSPSGRISDKIGDRRYWMILNAVVDDSRQGGNDTLSTSTTTKSQGGRKSSTISTSKIKKTNRIYINVDRWNSMFERLKEYKKTYGNTNVPKKYNDGGTPALGNWVSKQRFEALVYQNTKGEEGQITPERISKLESIGFVWELGRQDEWEEKWLSMFSELEEFQKKYWSTKVPILNNKELNFKSGSGLEDPMSSLGRWVKTQRIQRNKLLRNEAAPAMTKERLEMLESIDFAWSGKQASDYDKWLNMYFKLMFYYQRHGTTVVSDSQGSSRLLKWTEEQRRFYRDLMTTNSTMSASKTGAAATILNTLTEHRINLLNDINFDWSHCHEDRTWDDMFNELVEYYVNFNSTLISTSINERLGKWTILQRDKYNAGSKDLDRQKITKLNTINFDWNATEDVNWNAMMYRLEAYKRKYDTTIVPNHDGGDRPLANWVNNQRVKLGKYVINEDGEFYDDHDLVERIALDLGCSPETEFEPKGFIQKLSPSTKATRIRRLNEVGFVWDAREASWQDMYQRLLVYKEQNNGSTMVPFVPQDHRSNNKSSGSTEQQSESLGVWVKVQRHKKQLGEMSEKRLVLLNEIEFVWDPQEAQWAEMFDRLCKYQKENNGCTRVPRAYSPDPELGAWLNTNRRAYKRKTLPQERIDRLDSIGFVWEIQ